jgi:DMSO/TMAO reductase YedYZ heme-binding membrane subunit
MRSLELTDIALGAAAIILMFALLLASMPGWH